MPEISSHPVPPQLNTIPMCLGPPPPSGVDQHWKNGIQFKSIRINSECRVLLMPYHRNNFTAVYRVCLSFFFSSPFIHTHTLMHVCLHLMLYVCFLTPFGCHPQLKDSPPHSQVSIRNYLHSSTSAPLISFFFFSLPHPSGRSVAGM